MKKGITPKLAEHIIAVYRAMNAEAVDVDGNRLYIGSVSVLVSSIASRTFYAPILRALYDGGYAALLDRGGRSKPSTLLLLREPKEDELMALTMEADTPILSLLNRIDNLESNVGGVNVVRMQVDLDRRLHTIEERLGLSGKSAK